MRHHPTLCRTGRHGCWAHCSCGWQSAIYTTITGAHIAFGKHLTAAPNEHADRVTESKES